MLEDNNNNDALRRAHAEREAEALLRDYAEHLVERRLRSPALIARVQEAGM